MKSFVVLALAVFLMGCDPGFRTVNNLGSQSNFSDEEIPDDFTSPEDERQDPIDDGGISEEIDPDPIEIIDQIVFKTDTFFLEDQTFQLAHDSALRWDGCNEEYESAGGFNSDTRCGRAFFHPLFSVHLNDSFYRCVQEAAEDSALPQPESIFINHLGSYNDRNARNSSRLSNHAFARALDISKFILYDSEGQRYTISTLLRDYVGAQAVFYDSFRACWRDSLPENCERGGTEASGSIGHRSSAMGGNTLHNDHIHLSFPSCAG